MPEEHRERLAQLAQGMPGTRWVPPENLHLTLRFIGDVDGRQAHDIDAALSQIRAEGFPMTLAGVDRFGSGGRPRTLWVGVEPISELMRLQAKIEQAVQRAGLAPEGRKFKPHITLARFNGKPGDRLFAYLSRNALFRCAPFTVGEFVLYSSFLGQQGAIHTPEAAYPLARPAVDVAVPAE